MEIEVVVSSFCGREATLGKPTVGAEASLLCVNEGTLVAHIWYLANTKPSHLTKHDKT